MKTLLTKSAEEIESIQHFAQRAGGRDGIRLAKMCELELEKRRENETL